MTGPVLICRVPWTSANAIHQSLEKSSPIQFRRWQPKWRWVSFELW